MTEASCIPGRLLRFEDAHHAACDGLVRRAADLDEALATYRATCDDAYRAGTLDAVATIDEWRGSYRAFATWVGEVGRGFLAADAVDAYMYGTDVDPEAVSVRGEGEVAENFIDRFAGDPYLGVPAGNVGAATELAAEDQDDPPPWLEMLENGSLLIDGSSAVLEGVAKTLLGLPDAVEITLRVEGSTVAVLSSGRVVGTFGRAELTARLIVPKGSTAGLSATSRWLGRAANTAAFVLSATDQFLGDAGLPLDERIGRTTTRGLGVLGGTVLGAKLFGGGAAAGCAATVVGAPFAPLCGAGGAIIGGILGAIGGDWLVDQLPWMDEPDPPLPLEYDLDAVADVIADGEIDDSGEASIAAVDLAARDAALGRAGDDPAAIVDLEAVMPDEADLRAILDPEGQGPPTGTTTTTTTTPPPTPSAPPPTTTPATTPTGTTTPTTTPVPGGD